MLTAHAEIESSYRSSFDHAHNYTCHSFWHAMPPKKSHGDAKESKKRKGKKRSHDDDDDRDHKGVGSSSSSHAQGQRKSSRKRRTTVKTKLAFDAGDDDDDEYEKGAGESGYESDTGSRCGSLASSDTEQGLGSWTKEDRRMVWTDTSHLNEQAGLKDENGETVFEIEAILSWRRHPRRGYPQFRAKWAGFPICKSMRASDGPGCMLT